jgi:hypothetical protein
MEKNSYRRGCVGVGCCSLFIELLGFRYRTLEVGGYWVEQINRLQRRLGQEVPFSVCWCCGLEDHH